MIYHIRLQGDKRARRTREALAFRGGAAEAAGGSRKPPELENENRNNVGQDRAQLRKVIGLLKEPWSAGSRSRNGRERRAGSNPSARTDGRDRCRDLYLLAAELVSHARIRVARRCGLFAWLRESVRHELTASKWSPGWSTVGHAGNY